MKPSRSLAAALTAAALCLPATAGAAEVLYGVSDANTLVTFHSDSPGALRAAVPLTGLQDAERAIALDVRPKTGQLYLLGSTSRVYVVSPASGAAFPVGSPFTPALAGGNFGIDVDPLADRLRLVSDGRQNLRLNPEDGQVAGQDGTLAYADGDPGAGTTPSFTAAAYTGGAESRLFVIDTARDALATAAAPNDGKLTTVGPLGVDLKEPAELDIAGSGTAWVAARASGPLPELFVLDLATGRLAPGARRPSISTAMGMVRGIAAAGPVPDDAQRPSLLVSLDRAQTLKALRRLAFDASCSEACTLTAVLRRGRRVLARGTAVLTRAGRTKVTLTRTEAKTAFSGVLRVSAVDAASNRTIAQRRVRFG